MGPCVQLYPRSFLGLISLYLFNPQFHLSPFTQL